MKKASVNKKNLLINKLKLTCDAYNSEDKKMATQDGDKPEKADVGSDKAEPRSTPEPNQGQERSEKDAKWQKEQTEAAKAEAERNKIKGN